MWLILFKRQFKKKSEADKSINIWVKGIISHVGNAIYQGKSLLPAFKDESPTVVLDNPSIRTVNIKKNQFIQLQKSVDFWKSALEELLANLQVKLLFCNTNQEIYKGFDFGNTDLGDFLQAQEQLRKTNNSNGILTNYLTLFLTLIAVF